MLDFLKKHWGAIALGVGAGVVATVVVKNAQAAPKKTASSLPANQSGLVLAPGTSQPLTVAAGTSVTVDLPTGAKGWVSWTTPGGVTTALTGTTPQASTINETGPITIVWLDANGVQQTSILNYTVS